MTTIVQYADLPGCVGLDLGTSASRRLERRDLGVFADLTADSTWIHVNEEAARSGPFGVPIAHGLFTLSLTATFWIELFQVQDAALSLNYGFDRVRFAAPVRVGHDIWMTARITSVTIAGGGLQLTVDEKISVEGESKPAVAATALYRYYPAGV